MRLLGRLIFSLVLLALGAALFAALPVDRIRVLLTATPVVASAPPVETAPLGTIVYALDRQNWTSFPFSTPPQIVRLVTHADLPPEGVRDAPDGSWGYSIDYQVLSATGAVLRQDVIHLRAGLPLVRQPASGLLVPARIYASGILQPTWADETMLDVSGLGRPTELRLRLAGTEAPLAGASVRVYERWALAPGQATAAWERLSDRDRAAIAGVSALPASTLSPQERERLLRNRWHRIGPRGSEGVGISARRLVSVAEASDWVEKGKEAFDPDLRLSANRRATFEVPAGGGIVRLTAVALDRGAAPKLILRRLGRDGSPGKALSLPLASPSVQQRLEAGLIEVSASGPVLLQSVLLEGEGGIRDLLDELDRLQIYHLQGLQALSYDVTAVGDTPTPFRLNLRCICAGRPSDDPPTATYTITDAAGRSLVKGVIALDPEPSVFDSLADAPDTVLTEPEDVYFNLPPGTAAVSLVSDDPVLAAAFVRPPDLSRRVRVPEDQDRTDTDTPRGQTWFYLRPAGWGELVDQDRAPLVITPKRPPSGNPDIAAGNYTWERLLPDSDIGTSEILVPRSGGLVRTEGLAQAFVPIPPNAATRVTLASRRGAGLVRADLAYLKADAGSAQIRVLVDGTPLLTARIDGLSGVVALPALPAGLHAVTVEAEPVKAGSGPAFFLNHVTDLGASYLRRRATWLAPGATTFTVEKLGQAQETVSVDIFPVAIPGAVQVPGAEGRQTVKIRIEGAGRAIGPLAGWTLADRDYSLRIGPEAPDAPILGTGQTAGPARSFSVPLDADLPPGPYRITLTLEGEDGVYAVLSRTRPGILANRDTIVEE